MLRSASGADQPRNLVEVGAPSWSLVANDWSPDGKYLAYNRQGVSTGFDVWMIALAQGSKPASLIKTPAVDAVFSPNGRFVTYATPSPGATPPGIQAKRFPPTEESWTVTTAAPALHRWRRDGRELFFLSRDNRMMSVSVSLDGPKPEFGEAKALFEAPPASGARVPFDVSSDGQRFLFVTPVSGGGTAQVIHVVSNWRALLGKPVGSPEP